MTAMRASVRTAPGRSEVIELPRQEPGPGEVLVRVTACGVCASELHPWADAPAGDPLRFGHEPLGNVEAAGPDVSIFAPGDRVTGLFSPSFAEFAVARADRLLPVPPGLTDRAALGEPLACLVNAARRTPVAPGDTVVLIGLGYMGLGMLQLLRLTGAAVVLAVDPRAKAREHALALGADAAMAPGEVPEELVLTEFRDWESGRGAAVVVEASGTQAGLTLAGTLVRPHGLLSILGYHQGGDRAVDLAMWNWKAIDVVNAHVRRYADLMDSMRRGLDLQARGKLDLGRLVTHEYALDEVDRAFADLRDKPPGFVKGMVRA